MSDEFDFEYLDKLETDETAELPLLAIKGVPVLILAHAGQSNKGYLNGVIKKNKVRSQAEAKRQLDRADGDVLKEMAAMDRELYPTHVIRGWRGVYLSDGTEIPFSPPACHAFIRRLPDWLFQQIRDFASNPSNFVEEIEVDVKELVGNSPAVSSGSLPTGETAGQSNS